ELEHYYYEHRTLLLDGTPELLFTQNETNCRRLYGFENDSPYVKDGINDYLIHGQQDAVSRTSGTKAAGRYHLNIGPGESVTLRLRFTDAAAESAASSAFGREFDDLFAARQREADAFYATVIPQDLSADTQSVMRQAVAGMLWSKQFYHYD